MFGIGFLELCVIGVVALVFWGPQGLPELMKNLGKFFIQMQRVSSEFRRTVQSTMDEARYDITLEEEKSLSARPYDPTRGPTAMPSKPIESGAPEAYSSKTPPPSS